MESMLLLYDIYEIQKAWREAILQEQQRWHFMHQSTGTTHISRRWAA